MSAIPFILILLVFTAPRGLAAPVLALLVRELTIATTDLSVLLVFPNLLTCEGFFIPLPDLAFILVCEILFVFEKGFFMLVHLTTLIFTSSPLCKEVLLALTGLPF